MEWITSYILVEKLSKLGIVELSILFKCRLVINQRKT